MAFFRGPFNISSHIHTHATTHVTAGGGRSSHKVSTLSGKEGPDAKQVLGLTTKDWKIVGIFIVCTFTGTIALFWKVDRFY